MNQDLSSAKTNEPSFDPFDASPEGADQMFAGYLAAGSMTASMPPLASMAFEHGWRMRRNDMAGHVDADQRLLARRLSASEATRKGKMEEVRS